MSRTYYIDGYNVIHHCPQLGMIAAQDFEAARDALIEKVLQFTGATGERAKVVFDGRRGRQMVTPSFVRDAAPGLEIVYSPGHLSADALIERSVYASGQRRDIVVVTADGGIRELCRSLGAFVMSPANFLATVQEIRHSNVLPAPSRRKVAIEDRLDPTTLAYLRALRDLLKE